MRVALLFNTTRSDTTGVYFERACRALGLETRHWPLDRLHEVPSGYDLYLRVDHGDDYTIPLPPQLRPRAFYAIDTHLRYSWKKIRRMAHAYDWIFCAQRDAAEQLPNASWLPLACDAQWHGAIGGKLVWDVAFVGTAGGIPRKFYLQALRERYAQSCIGAAEPARIASVWSRSRIGFNYSIHDEVNMRVFEVLAAKTLLITNALSRDDLDRLGLHDGRHLVLYRNPSELLKLIDDMLSHPEERTRIAEQGHAVVMTRHTYQHRVLALLTMLGFSISAGQASLAESTA